MISRVRLSHWKKHPELDCEFRPGLNFVLGPNGRGKSSLLQGIKFGLIGEAAGVGYEAVRHGAAEATARVFIDDEALVVTHSIDTDGRISSEVVSNDPSSAHGTVDRYLTAVLGADPVFLREILFVFEGETARYERDPSLGLEHHLRQLLPIASLIDGQRQVQQARKPLSRILKEDRGQLSVSRDEIAETNRRIAELQERVRLLEAKSRDLEPLVYRMNSAAVHDRTRADAAARKHQWDAEWRHMLERIDGRIPLEPSATEEDVLSELTNALEEFANRSRAALTRAARAESRYDEAKRQREMLERREGETCPLCRQHLSDDHRISVVAALTEEERRYLRAAEEGQDRARELDDRVKAFRELLTELSMLVARKPSPPVPPATGDIVVPSERGSVERRAEEVRAELARAREELAVMHDRLRAARARLQLVDQVTETFRQDALLTTVDKALGSFEEALRNRVLTPLADELRREWKGFRPDAEWALTLNARGQLCIERQGEQLPYSSMSGGEKMLSLLLFRLSLVRALTKARFLVLDEPLEHLDPRSRRLLVTSLNHLLRQGVLDQIIVSTYEESLARRLIHRAEAHAVIL